MNTPSPNFKSFYDVNRERKRVTELRFSGKLKKMAKAMGNRECPLFLMSIVEYPLRHTLF